MSRQNCPRNSFIQGHTPRFAAGNRPHPRITCSRGLRSASNSGAWTFGLQENRGQGRSIANRAENKPQAPREILAEIQRRLALHTTIRCGRKPCIHKRVCANCEECACGLQTSVDAHHRRVILQQLLSKAPYRSNGRKRHRPRVVQPEARRVGVGNRHPPACTFENTRATCARRLLQQEQARPLLRVRSKETGGKNSEDVLRKAR